VCGRNPEAAPKWAAVALTRLLDDGPAASCFGCYNLYKKRGNVEVHAVKNEVSFFRTAVRAGSPRAVLTMMVGMNSVLVNMLFC